MSKTIRPCGLISTFVLLVVAFSLFIGCEKDSKGTATLTVTPSDVTLVAGTNSTVTFTVGSTTSGTNATTNTGGLRALSFPLEWNVSHPSLGVIWSSSGSSAVYVRSNPNGVNIVTVKDQYGAEGFATVRQE